MDCVEVPSWVSDDDALAEVVADVRQSGATVILGVVGDRASRVRRATEGNVPVYTLTVDDHLPLHEAAAHVYPVPGRCVLVVRPERDGWDVAPSSAGEFDPPPARSRHPVARPIPTAASAQTFSDPVAIGIGTAGGALGGALAFGAATVIVGAGYCEVATCEGLGDTAYFGFFALGALVGTTVGATGAAAAVASERGRQGLVTGVAAGASSVLWTTLTIGLGAYANAGTHRTPTDELIAITGMVVVPAVSAGVAGALLGEKSAVGVLPTPGGTGATVFVAITF